ncbi:MAG: hypothetical protein VX466_07005 [Myxococcota bacterium]|nr:hypothetical protein [Myxococcota bacterium]
MAASRLSLPIATVAFVALAGLGSHQFFKDGSFWLDEASLALSLLRLEPLQSFGPLIGDQSFPRLYLLAVHGLVGLLGYQTLVVRLLPYIFFVAATFAWLRLLSERFRNQPQWIGLGALLLAVPTTWFVYGAMFKPYTLDVFVSTIPFLLRDDFYDDILERGERPWRLAALACLGAISYPFSLVLLARVGGWWLQRSVAGRRNVAPRSLATGIAVLAIVAAWVWWMDLRHTAEIGQALRNFWSACLIGSDEVGTLALLDRFAFGWFDGRAEFAQARIATAPLVVLRIAFAAGLVRICLTLVRPGWLPIPESWGSRALGHAALLAGLPLASWLLGYPICAGRLVLFALLPVILVCLEGLDAAAILARRIPGGRWTALLATTALALSIMPASYENFQSLATAEAPENLRPLLARARERSELPILTTVCTRKQIETLPEGVPAQVLYVQEGGGIEIAISGQPEAWFLYIPAPFCRGNVAKVRDSTIVWERHHTAGSGPRLFFVRFPDL